MLQRLQYFAASLYMQTVSCGGSSWQRWPRRGLIASYPRRLVAFKPVVTSYRRYCRRLVGGCVVSSSPRQRSPHIVVTSYRHRLVALYRHRFVILSLSLESLVCCRCLGNRRLRIRHLAATGAFCRISVSGVWDRSSQPALKLVTGIGVALEAAADTAWSWRPAVARSMQTAMSQ
jgi:hypothetical protein